MAIRRYYQKPLVEMRTRVPWDLSISFGSESAFKKSKAEWKGSRVTLSYLNNRRKYSNNYCSAAPHLAITNAWHPTTYIQLNCPIGWQSPPPSLFQCGIENRYIILLRHDHANLWCLALWSSKSTSWLFHICSSYELRYNSRPEQDLDAFSVVPGCWLADWLMDWWTDGSWSLIEWWQKIKNNNTTSLDLVHFLGGRCLGLPVPLAEVHPPGYLVESSFISWQRRRDHDRWPITQQQHNNSTRLVLARVCILE